MDIVQFLRVSLLLFISGLAGTVAILMLFGRIRIAGVLRDKRTGVFSPARLQSTVVTLATAGTYLGLSITHDGGLPDPPGELIGALGGSHALYLGAKVLAAWRTRFTDKLI